MPARGRLPARSDGAPQGENDESRAILLGLRERAFPAEPAARPSSRVRGNVFRERRPDVSVEQPDEGGMLIRRKDKGRLIGVLEASIVHDGAPFVFEKDNPFVVNKVLTRKGFFREKGRVPPERRN